MQVQLPKDEALHIADSVPIPVCKFARANRHKLFREWADYGHDATEKHTFYGFRLHVLATLPDIIVGFALATANIHETQVIEGIVNGQRELLLGDRNYWSPRLRQAFEKQGLRLHTPFKKKSSGRDTEVGWSVLYGQVRYRIEPIFSQLEGRYSLKRVWARDMWHLSNRLIRNVLSHTLAVMLNQAIGNPPLQISKLLN